MGRMSKFSFFGSRSSGNKSSVIHNEKTVILEAVNPCACQGCIPKLIKAIQKCQGVVSVEFSEETKQFTVMGKFDEEEVIKHVRKATKKELDKKAVIVKQEDEKEDEDEGTSSSPPSSSQNT